MNETILTAAVERGLFGLTDEAGEQIMKLLRQVGQLEERNASLESGLKAVSARCFWRSMGYCDLACPGRTFCDAGGLRGFDFSRLQVNEAERSDTQVRLYGEIA